MKIMLLGTTVQVSFELQRSIAPLGEVIAPDRAALDLMYAAAVEASLNEVRPELIANAASWTAEDAADENKGAAKRLNAELPKQLAQYAAINKVKLVQYSNDYVYLGTGSKPWVEASTTDPLSVYGQTKLEGDEAIQRSWSEYLIFRTSWVYSARGNNFIKTMLHLAQIKKKLNIVADQMGVPTSALLIAHITALAIHSKIASGVYHLAPRGETSWNGFAQAIFSFAQQAGAELAMSPENAHPISTEYATLAIRPLNSRMVVTKLEHALNIQLPDCLAQAFIIGEDFIGHDSVCLVLGDNIYYGQGLSKLLQTASERTSGATVFGHQVTGPERLVVEFNDTQRAISIEERPATQKSDYAVNGLYFYDNDVVDNAKQVKPIHNGELEITSVNQAYLKCGDLDVELLGRGFAWLDTSTSDSLHEAAGFIETLEKRQASKSPAPEKWPIAWASLAKKNYLLRRKISKRTARRLSEKAG